MITTQRTFGIFATATAALCCSLMAPASAAADGIACRPTDVFENADTNLVSVDCGVAQNGIRWIAISASNAARAERFVSMAMAAMLAGTKFFVWTDDNSANNPVGCNVANCRRGVQFGLQK